MDTSDKNHPCGIDVGPEDAHMPWAYRIDIGKQAVVYHMLKVVEEPSGRNGTKSHRRWLLCSCHTNLDGKALDKHVPDYHT
jgi:hypothetical protein